MTQQVTWTDIAFEAPANTEVANIDITAVGATGVKVGVIVSAGALSAALNLTVPDSYVVTLQAVDAAGNPIGPASIALPNPYVVTVPVTVSVQIPGTAMIA